MAKDVYPRIYAVVARIPAGHVATYGQIARHLAMHNGARTVGWAMRHCPEGYPWHRVVNARGQISRRGGTPGENMQRALLEDEGVVFSSTDRLDLKTYGWDEI